MREIDEARRVIDPLPLDRSIRAVAFAHRPQHVAADPNLRVAIHAGLRLGHSRKWRLLHRRVAIAAVNAQSSNVMLMAERHRLYELQTRIGAIRRLHINHRRPVNSASEPSSPKIPIL